MSNIRFVVPLMLVVLVAAGCLPSRAGQSNDLEEMKRRLAVVEQATVSNQSDRSLEKRLDEQGKRQADLQAEVDALRFELQRVTGLYEDSVHQRDQLHELLSMIRSELELKVASLERRLAAQPAQQPAMVAVPVATNGQPGSSAKEQYSAALKLIQVDSRYTEGRKDLQRFLRDHPRHELVVNAIYWIGEAYYGEKQYEKAILQFQDVIQKFPAHAKAPAAMLKQGLAFGALGDHSSEKALLKKVTIDHPKSPEAQKAKNLLQKK